MSIAELKGKYTNPRLWAPLDSIEHEALSQLRNISSLPWVRHIAVMPDVHFGKGATVGSVIAMQDAISPAAVGVDIGCGMGAIGTNIHANDLPTAVVNKIYDELSVKIPVNYFGRESQSALAKRSPIWEQFKNLSEKVHDLEGKARLQCGTLGGGNHFIELCIDENDMVWLMLHSGSRNIGKMIAEVHINVAKTLEHNIGIVDKDLSVFLAGQPEFQSYMHDLMWAQAYAMLNRQVMMDEYWKIFHSHFHSALKRNEIYCHHNYVAVEKHFNQSLYVTRKGAIRAMASDYGIIPGAMGWKSFIVKGKENLESLHSASHGAGRTMSRSKAKKLFTLEDLAASTEGVVCRKDAGVLDEIRDSYKDIDQVMANQSDLVEIVHTLKAIMTVKG